MAYLNDLVVAGNARFMSGVHLPTVYITLPVASWTQAASGKPWTQTVSVTSMTEDKIPTISLVFNGSDTAATVKAKNSAWRCVDRAVGENGAITFYCYNRKPTTEITVQANGV